MSASGELNRSTKGPTRSTAHPHYLAIGWATSSLISDLRRGRCMTPADLLDPGARVTASAAPHG